MFSDRAPVFRRARLLAGGAVPLAWYNLTAKKPRLLRSSAGIGFAVLLMLMQLGFEAAFFNSSLAVIHALDADLVIESVHKYSFAAQQPFAPDLVAKAGAVPGVASASPLYADWYDSFWKNPFDGKAFLVRTFAFDPDRPVLRFPGVAAQAHKLTAADSVLIDRRARPFLGMDREPAASEINGRQVRVVGNFALGPDFQSDGTVITSAQTFRKLLPGTGAEAGIVTLAPGADRNAVITRLKTALPPDLAVLTKGQLLDREEKFQAKVSSAGPIFAMGTIVGFVVGMLISYQVIYADLSEQLPQYATLKAMGYRRFYLVGTVLEQAGLSALAGWVPAFVLSLGLYRLIAAVALIPLAMSARIAVVSLALTLGMCLVSAGLAVRRVLAADPAEVF
ncbi:MAG TPA: ABC transporter permease DevC [Stellaceae bacterium]|nr:ABC transporter permease DevC [Stellaceae bacterium]